MYPLSQAGILGKGARGLLMLGCRTTADAWAKVLSCILSLRCAPTSREGAGWRIWWGGLEAVDVKGLLSHPQGHPLQREIPDVGGRARTGGHGHGKGVSGSTAGLDSPHQSCQESLGYGQVQFA